MSEKLGLPTSWLRVTLGEVIAYGKTDKAEPNEIPADAWVLELEDIEKDTSKLLQRLTFEQRQSKSTKNRFVVGDVLYGKLRPYLNKVLVADQDGYCTTEILPFKPNIAINGRFLFYWLKHPEFLDYVNSVSHGLNMPRLGTEAGLKSPLVLAPLNEQKRIADKLDSLLARVDACRERLERVPVILKRFRQAVLAAATSGELTEDWRADNPSRSNGKLVADKLRSAHEAAGGHKAGNAAPPTEDVHNLTVEMFPQGWELLELREIVEPDRPITYGILKPGPDLKEGIPYVRVADFPNDQLNLASIRKTSPAIDKEFSRSRLRGGDILLSIRGTVGRLIAIPSELEGANITQDSARLSIQRHINRDYVLWYLRSDIAQKRMKWAEKGVAVRGINIGDVRALQVAIPSLEEQHEIVRRVETLFAYADRLEARYKAARLRVERLTPALLAKAFRGELVPQDPGDEPASVLLERIRAIRAAKADKPKTKQRATKTKTRAEVIMLKRENIQHSHLSDILKSRGPLTAETLWSASQLDIDDFYDQLKEEESRGLLKETRGSSDAPRRLEAA
ncbi:MAG: restriction endonuclease subunit S [Acidobacteriota bacterium]